MTLVFYIKYKISVFQKNTMQNKKTKKENVGIINN